MSVFVSKLAIVIAHTVAKMRRAQRPILKLVLTACFVISLLISFPTIAWAESAPELFEVHCAGCHPNGANIIRRGKNLKQRALKRYGYESADAIATLITNGKGLMSAYDEQLSEAEINSLATYVLTQAAIDWRSAK